MSDAGAAVVDDIVAVLPPLLQSLEALGFIARYLNPPDFGRVMEVAGFADSTGNADQNLALSQRRADAVVQYLVVTHNIPPRRIVTPIGYGDTRSGAENTPEAQRLDRRVETKILVSRGQNM